jgi:effector-binding domain-containing protein
MEPSVRIVAVEPRPTAVVAATTSWARFPTVWRTLLDEVWAFLRAHEDLRGGGHNVMLYRDDTPRVEVGVLVTRSFEGRGRVVPSALPGGEAAMTVHRGPYDGLAAAHAAVLEWCTANGRRVTRLRWEIYGDWHDDPSRLETEVYWQLAT